MPKPYKFRHVNEITGIFVLAVAALLILVVVAMATTQGWFTRTQRFTLRLPEDGAQGLKEGADVSVLGNVIGTVRKIHPDPADPDRLEAEIAVKADFARYIRVDSSAIIRRTLGFGDAFVEITRGKGALLPPDSALKGTVTTEKAPTVMLEATVADIRNEVVPALQEARKAFTEYRDLAADLRKPESPLQQALGRINLVTAKVERGEGLAGKLLSDPKMADDAAKTVPKVNASIDEIHAAVADLRKSINSLTTQTDQTFRQTQTILDDVHKTTAALPQTLTRINNTADALPGMIIQMQETLRQINRLVEGLQRSFLVRGSIAPENTGGRIRPEDVGSGGR